MKKNKNESYLQDPIGVDKEGNTITLLDILGTNSEHVLDQVTLTLDKDKLHQIINRLKPREAKILQWRFGLYNDRILTQQEVAQKLGISRSYVSRIEKGILTKMGNLFDQ